MGYTSKTVLDMKHGLISKNALKIKIRPIPKKHSGYNVVRASSNKILYIETAYGIFFSTCLVKNLYAKS